MALEQMRNDQDMNQAPADGYLFPGTSEERGAVDLHEASNVDVISDDATITDEDIGLTLSEDGDTSEPTHERGVDLSPVRPDSHNLGFDDEATISETDFDEGVNLSEGNIIDSRDEQAVGLYPGLQGESRAVDSGSDDPTVSDMDVDVGVIRSAEGDGMGLQGESRATDSGSDDATVSDMDVDVDVVRSAEGDGMGLQGESRATDSGSDDATVSDMDIDGGGIRSAEGGAMNLTDGRLGLLSQLPFELGCSETDPETETVVEMDVGIAQASEGDAVNPSDGRESTSEGGDADSDDTDVQISRTREDDTESTAGGDMLVLPEVTQVSTAEKPRSSEPAGEDSDTDAQITQTSEGVSAELPQDSGSAASVGNGTYMVIDFNQIDLLEGLDSGLPKESDTPQTDQEDLTPEQDDTGIVPSGRASGYSANGKGKLRQVADRSRNTFAQGETDDEETYQQQRQPKASEDSPSSECPQKSPGHRSKGKGKGKRTADDVELDWRVGCEDSSDDEVDWRVRRDADFDDGVLAQAPRRPKDRGRQGTKKRQRPQEEIGHANEDPFQSEPGLLKKIAVRQFMCHEKFSISPSRYVTLICGANGSGKSAVVAALQICLGAKAKDTHRAKKLSGLIRHGWKGDASVQVTLSNTRDGFKYAEYGRSISVKRIITQSGGGRFQLIGEDKKVKSYNRAELDMMLDTLNVQVDNPCSVLEQELSKKFLKDSEDALYGIFLRATELGRIKNAFVATSLSITKMQRGHDSAVLQVANVGEVAIKLKRELESLENLDGMEWDLDSIKIVAASEQIAMAWTHVSELERGVDAAKEEVTKQSLKIERLKKDKIGEKEAIKKSTSEMGQVKSLQASRLEVADKTKENITKVGVELREASETLSVLRDEYKILRTDLRAKIAELSKAGKDLQDAMRAGATTASGVQEKKLQERIDKADKDLTRVNRALDSSKGENSLHNEANRARSAASKAKESCKREQEALNSRRRELQDLSWGQGFDPLKALGSYMPPLVANIQRNADKFEHPVVGPIAANVQLKEEYKEYRVGVEAHIKRYLNNFVVASHRDKSTLINIMKGTRGRSRWHLPTIIVQPWQSKYSPPQNPPGHRQIMQAIDVKDDRVFNALVDQASIEKHCLYPSRSMAEEACLRGNSGSYQRMPYGMYDAIYLTHEGSGCSRMSINDGNIQTRMNVVNPETHRRLLDLNEDTLKREAARRVEVAEGNVLNVKKAAKDAEHEARCVVAALDKAKTKRSSLIKENRHLAKMKQQLEAELLALGSSSNAESSITRLERRLEEANEDLKRMSDDSAVLEDKIEAAEQEVKRLRQDKAKAKQVFEEATREDGTLVDRFQEAQEAKARRIAAYRKLDVRLTKEVDSLERRQREVKAAEENVKCKEEKVRSTVKGIWFKRGQPWDGKRENSALTLEQLIEKAKVKTAKLERRRKARGGRGISKNEVQNQLAEAVTAHEKKRVLCEKLGDSIRLLKVEQQKREEKWRALRSYIDTNTSLSFPRYLKVIGASGNVYFDHTGEKVEVTFNRNGDHDDVDCNDVKLLSGGESSLATLALLISLGEHVDSPFRVMDEFDVFMDAQLRDVAIRQITAFAQKDGKSRQMILITPQGIDSWPEGTIVKKYVMKPPRSRSQTLPEET